MADITTFFPGGAEGNAIPVANTLDDNNVTTPIHVWTGSLTDYNAIVTAYNADMSSHPDFLRTIYYTNDSE